MLALVAVLVIVVAILLGDWTHCNFSCHNTIYCIIFWENCGKVVWESYEKIAKAYCGYKKSGI